MIHKGVEVGKIIDTVEDLIEHSYPHLIKKDMKEEVGPETPNNAGDELIKPVKTKSKKVKPEEPKSEEPKLEDFI